MGYKAHINIRRTQNDEQSQSYHFEKKRMDFKKASGSHL